MIDEASDEEPERQNFTSYQRKRDDKREDKQQKVVFRMICDEKDGFNNLTDEAGIPSSDD